MCDGNGFVAKFLLSRNKDEALTYEKDIEKRIMSEVYVRQIRIKEFFEDFDPLRKGWVTEDKVNVFDLPSTNCRSSVLASQN
jgi:hypothetical protein